MQDLIILAVDPAKSTGWACSDGTSGVERFDGPACGLRLEKLPEVERHGVISARFALWLEASFNRTQAGVLVVERQMTHGTAAHLLLGMRMVALLLGYRRRLMVEECWASQWRPWAHRCGWWVKGDEADARAMLGWWTGTRLPLLEHHSSEPSGSALSRGGSWLTPPA